MDTEFLSIAVQYRYDSPATTGWYLVGIMKVGATLNLF